MGLFHGIVLSILGQVLTFLQLQGSAKYGWYEKYPTLMILLSIPIGWLFIKSVNIFVNEYQGQLWPSRLIGFGVGIIVFTFLSLFFFKESITIKTLICLLLSVSIISIQIFWK
jgi:hypothetical protein